MPIEIKGANLRRNVAEGSRRVRTHAIGFLDRLLELFERYEARIIGRVWIKEIGAENDSLALYTSSMQALCMYYQHFLGDAAERGVTIVDSRNKPKNVDLAHSLFTQKFKQSGDEYSHMLEMPTFGHSDNHAGLQLADLLCSAFLFPMAVHGYCEGSVQSVHVRPGYSQIKTRYGVRLRRLQHRYRDGEGRWRGGIVVSDGINRRSGRVLFV